MINKDKKYALYACCRPVKGFRRSAIFDLQRDGIVFIPNALYHILVAEKTLSYHRLCRKKTSEEKNTILEYLEYLLKHDLIFEVGNAQLFPPMSLHWDAPNVILNSIIDFEDQYDHWDVAILQLAELGCKHVQLRFFRPVALDRIESMLNSVMDMPIRSIEIILPHSNWTQMDKMVDLTQRYRRLFSIVIYGAGNEVEKNMVFEMGKILYIHEQIDSHLHCGKIHPTLFNNNISMFTEAQEYNTCLNRKISIDAKGEIANCPSLSERFGNIQSTRLEQVVKQSDFTKYWTLSKDRVMVCQDCEFRYVCTDCRAFVEDPENPYAKPLKCGYNPYTCQWETWSALPFKQKAIQYYGMAEIIPDFQLQPDYVPQPA